MLHFATGEVMPHGRAGVLPATQVVWLVVYWWSLLVNLYLLGAALLGEGVETYQVVIIVLAGVSVVLGSVFATRIARRGVTTVAFVKCTTTIRVIAVAWLMLGVVLIAVPILEVLVGVDTGSGAIASGLVGTIGTLSFLGMVGPGYAEYREAMAPRSRE